jgi:ABC-type Fe3+/spermidine/putrescine transport system ATPase subunit
VAEFIGTMNFFHGRLQAKSDAFATVDAGRLGILKAAANGMLPPIGSTVSVAVRPEKLSLSLKPRHGDNSIAGTVSAKAYFGDRSHYYVSVGGVDRLIAVAHQNVERNIDDPSAVGRSVWLSWAPEAAILLTE